MLSRLIVTFLCAAAIGSVSGTFLTFDPAEIEFEDIEATISLSVKLNSKPAWEVAVSIEHPFMFMSDCRIIFNTENWDVPQQLTANPAPLFVGSSNPPKQLASNTQFISKAETFYPLSEELSTTDTLKVTQKNLGSSFCFIKSDEVNTFDEMFFLFNKPGWYTMASTRDIEVQVFMDECKAGFSCIKKVLVRYGYSVMGMDVSGPAKDISEYSVTKVTQNTNGIQYNPGAKAGEHRIDFSYGSELEIIVVNKNGIVSLRVDLTIVAGYPSSRGLCNIPRPYSSDNKLVGSDGTLYKSASSEVDAFVDSWKVKDEDVLTNPGAKTLNLPSRQPGTLCKIPKTPRPNLTNTATITATNTATNTATITATI
ncbi:hypothetical protein BASA83_006782 [Batrachochytrium salamandrivorans]|nr:hypothetical protein BASA81_011879 [Batrachochytrium salamandrivorans]KAH9271029.1 hypothetical protein BASA83_006782 [Batrachochytrium salamandrivorans]